MIENIQTRNTLGNGVKKHRDQANFSSIDPLASVRNAPTDRPFVIAQLGQSLDGRIATLSGESRWINGDAALNHLHALRAHVDAVLIGVGTAVSDDPQLTVRRVSGTHPTRIVIDPNARLPDYAKCLNDDGVRRIVVRSNGKCEAAGAETVFLPRKEDGLCPREIIDQLFDRGIKRILLEGGARTISMFIDADAVDRLHVLVAPVLLGSGKPGLELAPIECLAAARRPTTNTHMLAGGEVLFDCDLRSCA